jgi:hypothetical protein
MKRWQNLVWAIFGLSGLLLAAGALTSAPAIAAAVRAALVRDTDNPAFQPVRVASLNNLGPAEPYRRNDFYVVPAGKRLVIENVSVFGFVKAPDAITGVWLNVDGQLVYLLLDPSASEKRTVNGGFDLTSYNRVVKAYYNPGETLYTEVFTEGVTQGKIVNIYFQGYLVTLP